jgi:hypothetical protein
MLTGKSRVHICGGRSDDGSGAPIDTCYSKEIDGEADAVAKVSQG